MPSIEFYDKEFYPKKYVMPIGAGISLFLAQALLVFIIPPIHTVAVIWGVMVLTVTLLVLYKVSTIKAYTYYNVLPLDLGLQQHTRIFISVVYCAFLILLIAFYFINLEGKILNFESFMNTNNINKYRLGKQPCKHNCEYFQCNAPMLNISLPADPYSEYATIKVTHQNFSYNQEFYSTTVFSMTYSTPVFGFIDDAYVTAYSKDSTSFNIEGLSKSRSRFIDDFSTNSRRVQKMKEYLCYKSN